MIETFGNIDKLGLRIRKSNNRLISIYKHPKRKLNEEDEFFDLTILILYLIESIYLDLFKEPMKEEIFPLSDFDLDSKILEYFSSIPNDVNIPEENEKDFGTLKYYKNRVHDFYKSIEIKFSKKNERTNGINLYKSPINFKGKLVLKLVSKKRNVDEKKTNFTEEILKNMTKVDSYIKEHLKVKKLDDFKNRKDKMNFKIKTLIQRIQFQKPDPSLISKENLIPIQIKEIEDLKLNYMERFAFLNIFEVMIPPEEFDPIMIKNPSFLVIKKKG